mmetsp:Transcript_1332/g.2384  ORF Transcript_1332/g.2384 Transcript_1332/m.2384 type:complete len:297 (-) Transcript_1332:345-1235(-)
MMDHSCFVFSPVTLLIHKGCPSGKPRPSCIVFKLVSRSFPVTLSTLVATTTRGTPMSKRAANTARSSSLGMRRMSTNKIPRASSFALRFPKYRSAATSTDAFCSLLNLAYPNPGKSTKPNKGFWCLSTKAYILTDAVAPGVFPTRACDPSPSDNPPLLREASRFKRELFPTLDRPKNATSGVPRGAGRDIPKWAPKNRIPAAESGEKRFQPNKARSAGLNNAFPDERSAGLAAEDSSDEDASPSRMRIRRSCSDSTFFFMSLGDMICHGGPLEFVEGNTTDVLDDVGAAFALGVVR